ncbi:hypothetical protein BCT94_14145 [Vibrio breoganii]|nr:hypothetical protein BCT94_14145 [Vibrio breoganii]
MILRYRPNWLKISSANYPARGGYLGTSNINNIAPWVHGAFTFNYPEDIRTSIYTTNAIESLNRVISRALKKRKIFPNDEAVPKWCTLRSKTPARIGQCPFKTGGKL